MGIYVLKRLLGAIPTLVIASLLVFAFIHLIPGDPASVMLGDMADAEDIAALRTELGLDRPIWEQYLLWVSRVLQGDFGSSIYFQEPVLRVIGEGAETSAFLALFTMILIIAIGIPAGIVSASFHGTQDRPGPLGAHHAVRLDPDLLARPLSDLHRRRSASTCCRPPAFRRCWRAATSRTFAI